MTGLNIYFGGEKKLSQDLMSELLYNLSYQVLSIDNKKKNIKFEDRINLNKNIKRLIRDVNRPNIETVKFENAINNTKDKVEAMEDEVVNNILTNKKVEFPIDFKPPMPNSLTEIENDIKKVKAIKRKTNESLNEIYGEITRDLVTKARNDLVKSITDYEGETPMEVINNVTASYKRETPVTKSVFKHVKESIKDRNQQYFKQKKPTVNKKKEKTTKPKLKITDIVNRDLLRSNSVTSIPLSEVKMLSRSASLDSIVRYNDQEMISRPSSVASIREQSIKFIKPKPTIVVKPKQPLIETVNTKSNEKILTAAAKAVIKNKQAKNIKSTVKTDKTKQKVTVIKLPTISLSKSIDKSQKQIIKKKIPTQTAKERKQKAAAAKADIKTKQQEQVVK